MGFIFFEYYESKADLTRRKMIQASYEIIGFVATVKMMT